MSNRRKTTEQFKKEVYDLVKDEYKVLGEYKNNKTLIEMKHDCGYIFSMRPMNFLNLGNRCPDCAGLVKKTTEQFKKEVYDLVGDEYTVLGEYKNNNTNIKMKHNECNNIWEPVPKWFLKGTRCPECSHPSYAKTTNEFKKEVYDLVGDEYTVLGEYKNNRTHIEMIHNKCGHKYEVIPYTFLNNRRCPNCSLKDSLSASVKEIINFF